MGLQPSNPYADTSNFVHPFTEDLYIPVGASRMNDERNSSDILKPNTNCKTIHRVNVLKTGYTGIWSVTTANNLGPVPRTGHFYCYDPPNHTVYIGYGITQSEQPLNDFWALDTLTYNWREIKLYGAQICPRSGSRACLIGTHIVIFGGYCNPNYFSDLHTIDITTGEVVMVQTQGTPPSPRSSPIVCIGNNKFFVWGGFNGEWPNELNVLDLQTMTWSQVPQQISGRAAVPFVPVDNILYSYGGSKLGGFLCLNMETYEMAVRECIGAPPPSQSSSAGMVLVEKYLFYFGGKANNKWTLMYACDIQRLWWFVFHVMPDGESVSISDGSVSEQGLFMLPRIHSFGVCYVAEKRTILAFLGYPEKDPPPLFTVYIGDAMAVIHHREDMLAVLNLS
ncbi:Kelch motif family protein [Histomonas meleagridis]|uniref:Kelch motif family protein n=1 Tax=Histomonas meleagridis TaxID=135588 RepID=UPI003559B314|nr:Kelch motif family protein [Histomonas meleagridis]KAH0798228.1 Kelch motif family protein [Histomonas meleagridis]